MIDLVLEDRMRVAIDGLIKAQTLLLSAVSEAQVQGYTTEAINLDTVLADLVTRTNDLKTAVS